MGKRNDALLDGLWFNSYWIWVSVGVALVGSVACGCMALLTPLGPDIPMKARIDGIFSVGLSLSHLQTMAVGAAMAIPFRQHLAKSRTRSELIRRFSLGIGSVFLLSGLLAVSAVGLAVLLAKTAGRAFHENLGPDEAIGFSVLVIATAVLTWMAGVLIGFFAAIVLRRVWMIVLLTIIGVIVEVSVAVQGYSMPEWMITRTTMGRYYTRNELLLSVLPDKALSFGGWVILLAIAALSVTLFTSGSTQSVGTANDSCRREE